MSGITRKIMSTGGAPDPAWDLSYAYLDDYAGAWDLLANANQLDVGGLGGLSGIYIRADGRKMYGTDASNERVVEYDLSTAWDVATASYLQDFDLTFIDSAPTGLYFKPDGIKMYVIGNANDSVYEFDLSTAWDISTAVLLQSTTAVDSQPQGVYFRDDGLKMYTVGDSSNILYEYDLSTAWDISTSTIVRSRILTTQDAIPRDLHFKPDGTVLYISGDTNDRVYEYSLSTAWNISTMVYVKQLVLGTFSPLGLFFKPDGTRIYLSVGVVRQIDLAGFSVNPQESSPTDVAFSYTGTKMYILGGSGQDVNEYDLSVAWDTSTAVYLQNFSVSAQDTSPQGIYFRIDGTKMYMLGLIGRDVNEYDLSSAWNISTASYVRTFFVGGRITAPLGVEFSTDGTKMYVAGDGGNDINEYNLGTAWNISTATFVRAFVVTAQDTAPQKVRFKSDGTKMYVLGGATLRVLEYRLSTAWDVSTAVYIRDLDLPNLETSPKGMHFSPEGLHLFVVGTSKDRVYRYTLGIQ